MTRVGLVVLVISHGTMVDSSKLADTNGGRSVHGGPTRPIRLGGAEAVLADDGDDARGSQYEEHKRAASDDWPLKLQNNNGFYLRMIFPRVDTVGAATEA